MPIAAGEVLPAEPQARGYGGNADGGPDARRRSISAAMPEMSGEPGEATEMAASRTARRTAGSTRANFRRKPVFIIFDKRSIQIQGRGEIARPGAF